MTTDAESRCLGQGRAAAHPSCGRDPPIDLAVVRLVVAAGHLARGPAPPPAAGRAARHPGRAGRGPARARPSTGGRCPAGAGYGGASGRARRRQRGCRAARRAQQPPRPAVLRAADLPAHPMLRPKPATKLHGPRLWRRTAPGPAPSWPSRRAPPPLHA